LPSGILNYLPEREKMKEMGIKSWMRAKRIKPDGVKKAFFRK
jgi:hypothetical protein